jgi:hypothetical protein
MSNVWVRAATMFVSCVHTCVQDGHLHARVYAHASQSLDLLANTQCIARAEQIRKSAGKDTRDAQHTESKCTKQAHSAYLITKALIRLERAGLLLRFRQGPVAIRCLGHGEPIPALA